MKTLHTETVNGGVRRHQDKRFFFQFGKRDRFFGRGGMSFRKNSNQTVCCESMKSIELRVYHVFLYKDQIKKVFFKTGKKFFVFYILQRKRKLRVCITKTVYHRSKMVLRKKRKCSNMKCLEFTVLKMVHCFQRAMILSGNLKCFFVKKSPSGVSTAVRLLRSHKVSSSSFSSFMICLEREDWEICIASAASKKVRD